MTVALGTNIANPISTALSQWLGFDTMGKLANYGKLGVTDPDAVIKALFANSEQGAFYDPSDLTTMFQDRAGTTPVTADGQTVGKILDKSGRGNHATALNDAARPLYKTDGTYHWLLTDGVDDVMNTAAINMTAASKVTVFCGVERVLNTPVRKPIVMFNGDPNAVSGSFDLNNPDDPGIMSMNVRGTQRSGQAFASTPALAVLTGEYDLAGLTYATSTKLRINSVGQTGSESGSPDPGGGTFGNGILRIAMIIDQSYHFGGKIYSLIVRGAPSTTQEITDTETWVNGKTGAY